MINFDVKIEDLGAQIIGGGEELAKLAEMQDTEVKPQLQVLLADLGERIAQIFVQFEFVESLVEAFVCFADRLRNQSQSCLQESNDSLFFQLAGAHFYLHSRVQSFDERPMGDLALGFLQL